MDEKKNQITISFSVKWLRLAGAILGIAVLLCGIFFATRGQKKAISDKSFILNIDGIKYDIKNHVGTNASASVLVDDYVMTQIFGFSQTVNEQDGSVSYTKNMDSFTFYPDDSKYVYNDKVMHTEHECYVKQDVYYVNLIAVMLDLGYGVSQGDTSVLVTGYYKNNTAEEDIQQEDAEESGIDNKTVSADENATTAVETEDFLNTETNASQTDDVSSEPPLN